MYRNTFIGRRIPDIGRPPQSSALRNPVSCLANHFVRPLGGYIRIVSATRGWRDWFTVHFQHIATVLVDRSRHIVQLRVDSFVDRRIRLLDGVVVANGGWIGRRGQHLDGARSLQPVQHQPRWSGFAQMRRRWLIVDFFVRLQTYVIFANVITSTGISSSTEAKEGSWKIE